MSSAANDIVRGSPVIINDNGAWGWFQAERALVVDGKVLVGSVASAGGVDGALRDGDIDLSNWDLATGAIGRVVLHAALEGDDHNAPALYVRQDGRVLAVYGKHGRDKLQRWRISDRPHDASTFGPEATLALDAAYCYQNVYRLSAENGRLYNFHRSSGWNPNYSISDDDGTTWRYGGRFISWARPTPRDPAYTGIDGGRPYARYASNNVDAVHVLVTEDHPRAYDNSVYHGFVRAGEIFQSDGSPLAPLSTTTVGNISPEQLTKVFQGDADNVAWVSDLRLDSSGLPYAVFTVQKNDSKVRGDPTLGGEDIRYWYARFDGRHWYSHEIAHGGRCLYSPEVDYSGLVTLHPYDPKTLYLSTNADPGRGTPLISAADGKRHHEIFRGRTNDGGRQWTWTQITSDSTRDNLRPIVVTGDPAKTVLLWLRGTYHSYTAFATEVVGIIDTP